MRQPRRVKRPPWPDLFEAERLVAETRLARKVASAFAAIRPAVFAELERDLVDRGLRGDGTAEIALGTAAFNESFWLKQRQTFYRKLSDQHKQILQAGVQQASQLGVAVDIDGMNETVNAFTGIYEDRWWSELSGTMRQDLRTALQKNIETGNLAQMKRDLAPTFGQKRADLVARTETTRLYSEGNRLSYKADGVQQVEWRTVGDGRVDPVCADLDGEKMPVEGATMYPPAHPGCRCWIAPVIDEKPALAQVEIEDIAKDLRRDAINARPKVTRVLNRMVKSRDGKLVGRKFAVKSKDSLTRKLSEKVAQGVPRDALTNEINDALRYTMQFSDEAYAANTQSVLLELEGQGYKVQRVRNYWSVRDGYQGTNSVILSPEGQTFELQFHTPVSHRIKEEAHLIYQKTRGMQPGAPLDAMNAEMNGLFNTVAVPEGAPLMQFSDLGLGDLGNGAWASL